MRINVKVIANSSKERIEEQGEVFRVYVNVPPIEGRANRRVVELLAEHFKVKKYSIEIVSGEKTNKKVIDIKTA